MTTMHLIPALAAYAAAAADVFPVDAQMTVLLPASFALATAMTMPRSLNEPVGLLPSVFTYSSMPHSWDIRFSLISGVLPSFRESIGVSSFTGRYSL
ncbi:Uncharacterised protein [Mycobacteroides abscessus subsp. abscessus]|nr:Uncharacterised protein [Mycobacteroides abscessus subsp. abscessus]